MVLQNPHKTIKKETSMFGVKYLIPIEYLSVRNTMRYLRVNYVKSFKFGFVFQVIYKTVVIKLRRSEILVTPFFRMGNDKGYIGLDLAGFLPFAKIMTNNN